MNPDLQPKSSLGDKASAFMVLDIVGQALRNAENPGTVGRAHGPAHVHRGLAIGHGADIVFDGDPGNVGDLHLVFPDGTEGNPVIADRE